MYSRSSIILLYINHFIATLRKVTLTLQLNPVISTKSRHLQFRLVKLYAVCSMEEPIYIIEELMDQCLNKYLQEQTTQDKTSLKDLTNMAAQVRITFYLYICHLLSVGIDTLNPSPDLNPALLL